MPRGVDGDRQAVLGGERHRGGDVGGVLGPHDDVRPVRLAGLEPGQLVVETGGAGGQYRAVDAARQLGVHAASLARRRVTSRPGAHAAHR